MSGIGRRQGREKEEAGERKRRRKMAEAGERVIVDSGRVDSER